MTLTKQQLTFIHKRYSRAREEVCEANDKGVCIKCEAKTDRFRSRADVNNQAMTGLCPICFEVETGDCRDE